MNILEEKVENQVQFWSLLGPFLMFLSIGILLFKAAVHWYFPLSLLVGIPLCVIGKMRGMVAALSCLFFFSLFAYSSIDWEERYWHVGMALAMAFSFLVLTLSLEEVQGLVQKLHLESQSRLDNFLHLDEKWNQAEKEWGEEKDKRRAEITALTQQLDKTGEEKQTFYKLAQLAKDELLQMRGQYDLLRQELIYKKQETANLHERMEETDMTLQRMIDSNGEKQIKELTHQLACLQGEHEELEILSVLKQEECSQLKQEKTHLEKEKMGELEAKEKILRALRQEREQFQHQLREQQLLAAGREEQVQQLNDLKWSLEQSLEGCHGELASLKEKKLEVSQVYPEELSSVSGNTRRIEEMYGQLRQQFEEKSVVLDTTRRELFKVQEEILRRQKESEEKDRFAFSEEEERWQAHLLAWGRRYEQMEDFYEKERGQLSELIDSLLY